MIITYITEPEDTAVAYSQKKLEYNIQYAKDHKKRIPLDVRREYYENVLCLIPEVTGMGINTFIKAAITEKIKRDKLKLPINQYRI